MAKTAKAGDDNMKDLNWRKAKRDQLYEIAYNDPGASAMHRQQAKAEISRRLRQRHSRVQYKIKQKYK